MTQSAETIAISDFAPRHLDGAVRLSAEAGWPHRRDDWAFVMTLSKGLVALRGGDVVGTGFATLFDAHTAACSLIVVDERMRGQGLGRRLMNALIETAGARQIRLVSTEDGLALYRSLGFQATGEVRQHQGVMGPVGDLGGMRWSQAVDVQHLSALDCAAFGADRRAVMAALCAAGSVVVPDSAAPPSGFAIVRPFGRGKVVGPVIAESAAEAKA
ncbi:MAG: GNAT family N-acetyltransferase, partial [Pseudomonadota bacterium]